MPPFRLALSSGIVLFALAGCVSTPTASSPDVIQSDDPASTHAATESPTGDCDAIAASFTGLPVRPEAGTIGGLVLFADVTLPEPTCVVDFGTVTHSGVLVYNGDEAEIIAELSTAFGSAGWDINPEAPELTWLWKNQDDASEFDRKLLSLVSDEQLERWMDPSALALLGSDPVLFLCGSLPAG